MMLISFLLSQQCTCAKFVDLKKKFALTIVQVDDPFYLDKFDALTFIMPALMVAF